jgi:hypothetical protein
MEEVERVMEERGARSEGKDRGVRSEG